MRRFRRDNRAATAVEFALVALPFFALVFAILETFLVLFVSEAVEDATERGARMIRIGEVQTAGMNSEAFRLEICDAMIGLFNCDTQLQIDVQNSATFADVDLAQPIDGDGNLIEAFQFEPGGGGDIVVVRAFLEWPIHTNILGLGLANLSNGKRLIASAAVFRNEPFEPTP